MTIAALRKPLLAAIASSGGQPWSKLWTALRATRDTELRDKYPGHVVVAWLGHDEMIAQKNYTQVTDEHFAQGVGDGNSAAESGAVALQNGVQQRAAKNRNESQDLMEFVGGCGFTRKDAKPCVNRASGQVGGIGLEPTTSTMST